MFTDKLGFTIVPMYDFLDCMVFKSARIKTIAKYTTGDCKNSRRMCCHQAAASATAAEASMQHQHRLVICKNIPRSSGTRPRRYAHLMQIAFGGKSCETGSTNCLINYTAANRWWRIFSVLLLLPRLSLTLWQQYGCSRQDARAIGKRVKTTRREKRTDSNKKNHLPELEGRGQVRARKLQWV